MNKARRTAIQEIIDKLSSIAEDIAQLSFDENDAYQSLPDSIQCSDRGLKMEAAYEALDDAQNSVTEAIEYLTTAKE